jgi:hypothetical protein
MTEKTLPPQPSGKGAAAGLGVAIGSSTYSTSPTNETQGHAQDPRRVLLRPSEDDLARAFAERYAGKLCYVDALTARVAQRWFIRNDAGEWTPDRTLAVPWLVREFCAEYREHAEDDETALRLGSRDTAVAVELMARCDPRLARTKADIGKKPRPTQEELNAEANRRFLDAICGSDAPSGRYEPSKKRRTKPEEP